MIYNIAKNELKNLFFSPVAWFILVAFLIQCSYFYHENLVAIAHATEVLNENNPEDAARKGLNATLKVLGFKGGFIANVLSNLFLFIPLLTMGLMNRELSNGTMSLLMSSPVKRNQLVLGKYLGMMLFNGLLLLIISVFLIATAMHVRNVEINVLITTLIGFTLLLGMYSAIGLFISTIARSQIIAAIATFMVLISLTKIGFYWQEYDFFRDISYFLSIQKRVLSMLLGLFKSRDVLYFLVMIGMFLGFTWIKLDTGIRPVGTFKKVARYTLVAVIGLTIGVVGSMRKYTLVYDATHLDRYTIPESYQRLIQSFDQDDPLEVTIYTNLLHDSYLLGDPKLVNRVLDDVWDPWIRFNPSIKFKYEYYYDYNPVFDHYLDKPADSALFKQFQGSELRELAYRKSSYLNVDLERFKTPEQMREEIDLDSEGYCQLVVMRYKGRSEVVRYYPYDPFYQFPDLQSIADALKALQNVKKPEVVFVTGHLERDIHKPGRREYSIFSRAKFNRRSLVNTGYEVDTVNLATQDIPTSTSTLVIADPKVAFTETDLKKLANYVDKGGNLIVLSVPGKQVTVNPLLKIVGLELMEGQLATHIQHHPSNYVQSLADTISMMLAPNSPRFAETKRDIDEKKHTHNDEGPSFDEGAVAIKVIDSSTFKPLRILKTPTKNVWLQRRPLVLDSAKYTYTPSLGDSAGVFDIGMMLTRKLDNKEQRVIVMNGMLNHNDLGNSLMEVYTWLHYDQYPMYIPGKYQKDQIRVGHKAAQRWKFVFLYILPSLVFIAATVLLVRRKRR